MTKHPLIDPELLERAFKLGGELTREAVVTSALREFIARHEQSRVIEYLGRLEWDAACDYKSERSRD